MAHKADQQRARECRSGQAWPGGSPSARAVGGLTERRRAAHTLPAGGVPPRIYRALTSDPPDLAASPASRSFAGYRTMVTFAATVGFALPLGCARRDDGAVRARPAPVTVVAVAPVLNLSGSSEWDALKVTDILASELQSSPDIMVIPVNRVLAALALRGRRTVETPQDAIDVADELGADATVVAAITEYQPYDPPIVGIVLQWYARRSAAGPAEGFDPVSASRQATEVVPSGLQDGAIVAPLVQIQRVYNAADASVRKDVQSFAKQRAGYDSPYGWEIHVKAQELFVRYCCKAAIESMLLARQPCRSGPAATRRSDGNGTAMSELDQGASPLRFLVQRRPGGQPAGGIGGVGTVGGDELRLAGCRRAELSDGKEDRSHRKSAHWGMPVSSMRRGRISPCTRFKILPKKVATV